MTPAEARELLLFHSGAHERIEDERWKTGFLGVLRPYSGLREENYHSAMACLRALAPVLGQPLVDREVVASVWAICHLGRAWGVSPEGMLRRNGLITAEDSSRLEQWIEQISYTMLNLLEGAVEEAFAAYDAEPEGRSG